MKEIFGYKGKYVLTVLNPENSLVGIQDIKEFGAFCYVGRVVSEGEQVVLAPFSYFRLNAPVKINYRAVNALVDLLKKQEPDLAFAEVPVSSEIEELINESKDRNAIEEVLRPEEPDFMKQHRRAMNLVMRNACIVTVPSCHIKDIKRI